MGLNYDSIFITCPTCTGRFCWLAWWGHWTCLSERLTMVAYRDGWSSPRDLGDGFCGKSFGWFVGRWSKTCEVKFWWNTLWNLAFWEKKQVSIACNSRLPSSYLCEAYTQVSVVNGYLERFTYNHQMKGMTNLNIHYPNRTKKLLMVQKSRLPNHRFGWVPKKTLANNGRFQLPTFPSTAESSPDFWLPPTSHVVPKPTVFCSRPR